MYCTKCGAKNEDDAKYCEQCGAKLQNTVDNIKPAVLPDKHVPKKEKRGHTNIKIAPQNEMIIISTLQDVVKSDTKLLPFVGSLNGKWQSLCHSLCILREMGRC